MDFKLSLQVRGPLFGPDAAARVDREISATLAELGALGQRLVVDAAPRGISSGGGGLRGSVFSELRGTPLRRTEIISSPLFYAPIVEAGRTPGRRPPPNAPLRLWAIRKLGIAQDKATSVAFLIGRAIGRRGTTGAHMFEQAMGRLRPVVARASDTLAARLAAVLGGRG